MDFPEGFVWDDEKRRLVLTKHGIDFRHVINIFKGPVIDEFDLDHAGTEDRYRAIGCCDGRVYVVVYAFQGRRRRIITAWRANREQTRTYFMRFFGDSLA